MTALNSELNEPEKFSKRTSFLRGVNAFGYMGGYILGAALEDIKTFYRHPVQTLKDLFPLTMQTEILCIKNYSGNPILDWVNPKMDDWKNNPKGTLAASPMDNKKDPKVETLPAPTLEKLDPFDQRRELTSINKDVESCRASDGAARGSVAFVKMKVEGATGRVLEASAAAENTAAENTAAARCIAKVVKSKVKFPRFKQKAQEFIYRFPM